MDSQEQAQCPLCGAHKIKTVLKGSPWRILSCSVCTNAWTEPPPGDINYSQDNFHACIQRAEQDASPKSLEDLHPLWKKSVLMQANLLTRSLQPNACILEIGCGEGLLLLELARRGFNVMGVEPSNAASEAARKAGLNVLTGYFPDMRPVGKFDAVIMSHVLEHISRPVEALAVIGHIAPAGAALFVQTNWQGLVPRVYRRRWYAWAPTQHFWHFTPRGLETLLRPLGWTVREVECSSLIHTENLLTGIVAWMPSLYDQFHLLAALS